MTGFRTTNNVTVKGTSHYATGTLPKYRLIGRKIDRLVKCFNKTSLTMRTVIIANLWKDNRFFKNYITISFWYFFLLLLEMWFKINTSKCHWKIFIIRKKIPRFLLYVLMFDKMYSCVLLPSWAIHITKSYG